VVEPRVSGFVRVADAFSTGSSMMPNKKNPDPGRACSWPAPARVIGELTGMLTLLKGLPLAYQRDLPGRGRAAVRRPWPSTRPSLGVMAGLIETLSVDADRNGRGSR